MLDILFTNPPLFLIWVVALLVTITVHEFAHALAAEHLGDPTPKLMGRLTLNPIAHLDPIGTLLMVLFRFGWGKPVVFDPYNLKNPRRDSAIISIAGPFSNFALASVLSLFMRFLITPFSPLFFLSTPIQLLIILNIWLGVFNLIPVHPLDGGKILVGILPAHLAHTVDLFLNKFGIIILILILLTPIIPLFIFPITNFFTSILIPGNSVI